MPPNPLLKETSPVSVTPDKKDALCFGAIFVTKTLSKKIF